MEDVPFGFCLVRNTHNFTPFLGPNGLLYYNSLIMIVPALGLAIATGELELAISFRGWQDPSFIIQFGLCCIYGFILNYSSMLCIKYNSALTTTIVGCFKNIVTTFLGGYLTFRKVAT
jgi:solute carrier family 35 protein